MSINKESAIELKDFDNQLLANKVEFRIGTRSLQSQLSLVVSGADPFSFPFYPLFWLEVCLIGLCRRTKTYLKELIPWFG